MYLVNTEDLGSVFFAVKAASLRQIITKVGHVMTFEEKTKISCFLKINLKIAHHFDFHLWFKNNCNKNCSEVFFLLHFCNRDSK